MLPSRAAPDKGDGRAIRLAILATTAAIMPAFLVAATSPLLRSDLRLPPGATGLTIGGFFGVQALSSLWGGRRADQLGARAGMRIGALGAGTSLGAIALFAQTAVHLTIIIAVAGVFNGITQPATNLALASVERRPALVYSLKQASVPFASLLAGLLVPIVALPLGWRAVFGLAAVMALVIGFTATDSPGAPLPRPAIASHHPAVRDPGPLVVLALSAGLASAAAVSLSSYLVEGSTQVGISVKVAGWLLGSCGAVGIVARVAAGWVADRRPGAIMAGMAGMLAIGAGGFLLLAGATPWSFALGALVVYSFGWGWSGVLWYAVVRTRPDTPAMASGIVSSGAAAGACLGPLAFGAMVDRISLDVAWLAAGAGTACACLCAVQAHRMVSREAARAAASG